MELLKTKLTSVLDELEEKNNRITNLHNELSVANDKHKRAIVEVISHFRMFYFRQFQINVLLNFWYLFGVL